MTLFRRKSPDHSQNKGPGRHASGFELPSFFDEGVESSSFTWEYVFAVDAVQVGVAFFWIEAALDQNRSITGADTKDMIKFWENEL